ncbi:fasciclin domain-containing protein [uncultured Erythrobacter sp.]|uniref:fasciclin domain-containing protein n=1 Tax=uncultured Erythrobacter sp. TaxID=263913 RepID=UPI002626AAF0|nr:fasciclin domain-containing protein [uncultured Erythrobacter sp.]
MITLKKTLTTSFVTVGALALAACGAEPASDETVAADESTAVEETTTGSTIVDVAAGDESFSTLVAAVTAADLGETLSAEGPFTVFAPVNDAFAKLPEGTVETLTTEDTETLTSILTYHVVPGTIDAATLIAAIEAAGEEGYTITTAGGGTFTAAVVDDSVVLTDATGATSTVTATNVEASNGLIHVIDTVLMPG